MVLALEVALAVVGASREWGIPTVCVFLVVSCHVVFVLFYLQQKIIIFIYLCLMLQFNMQKRGVFLRPFCAGSGHGGIIEFF